MFTSQQTISSRGITTQIIGQPVKHTPSLRVAEIERMKGVRHFKACNCGSPRCNGKCPDAAIWRRDYINNYGQRKTVTAAQLAESASTAVDS